ncbi:hypothetical protein [Ferrimonas lipolytica]|nr:hypothetical protein [Ferrimonas lipolytica]
MNKNIQSSLDEKKVIELNQYSGVLRKVAWAIEFVVVFIGLCISVFLVLNSGTQTSAFILAAPFVMISIVELAKIPFVVGLWHARKSFPLYLVMITLLCTLTFETLLNGFERAFSSINEGINIKEIEISRLESNIEANLNSIDVIAADYKNESNKYDLEEADINDTYQQAYTSAVEDNKVKSKSIPVLLSSLNIAKQELIDLKVEKANLLLELAQKKEEKFKDSIQRLDNSDNAVSDERKRLLSELQTLKIAKEQAINDANFFTRGSVKIEYDKKIRYTNDQLNNINNRTLTGDKPDEQFESVKFLDNYYSDLLSIKDDLIAQKSAAVASLNSQYVTASKASYRQLESLKSKLLANRNAQLDSVDAEREELDNEFKNQKLTINSLLKENNQLHFDIRRTEIETNSLALSNQIYRMASYIDNVDNYKEIKKNSLTLVGLIWFGSLAFIGSITGVALTLSGLHLKSLADKIALKREQATQLAQADTAQVASNSGNTSVS